MSERFFRTFGLFLSLTLCIQMSGQISSLKIQSADSTLFNLAIDDALINDAPNFSVLADSLSSGNKRVEIRLFDAETKIQLEIKLSAQTAHIYDLVKIGDDYTLLLFSKTPITAVHDHIAVAELETDSLEQDSIYFGYSGPKGCLRPVNDLFVSELKNELDSEIFESSRRKKIEQSFNLNCLSVDQFSVLLSSIELEDYKLELSRKAASKLYDRNNFLQLESLFELKSSIESLRKIYQNEFIEN